MPASVAREADPRPESSTGETREAFGELLRYTLAGFRPDTQILTALETIAANPCWLPPLVGWLAGRRDRFHGDGDRA